MRAKSLLLMFAVALSAANCSSKNPTAPSAPEAPKPVPFPGTEVHPVEVAGSDKPIEVWVSMLSPAKSSILAIGQRAIVQWDCGGPDGYTLRIGAMFMTEPASRDPSLAPIDRCGIPVGGPTTVHVKCEQTNSRSFTVDANTPNIIGVRFYAWAVKGDSFSDTKPRCADGTFEEATDWKSPNSAVQD